MSAATTFKGRRAAVYARISDDREGTALGVARQLDDARALVERRGWTVVAEYTDNDISAYSGKRRPGYERLLDAVVAGEADVVVAWHPDRLHRSPRELERFIEAVEAAGVAVATVQAGDIDLSTPTGRMVARIVGATARHESEHKAERIKRKHRELALAGRWTGGGGRPFGYAADRMTVIPEEAELIREAAADILAGSSLRGVVRRWNDRGLVTSADKPWHVGALRRLLTSARVAGWREYAGTWAAPAVWPAILDRATVEQLRSILLDPERRTTRSSARVNLLPGMIRCGRCGKRMVGRPRADGVRRYVCPAPEGCTAAILAEPIEKLVVAAVLDALDGPELAAAVASAEGIDTVALIEQIATDEAAMAQAAADHYTGTIGRSEYLAARDALERRIEANRRKLDAAAGPASAVAGVAAVRWPQLDLDRRRAIVGAVIDEVTVAAAVRGRNRFDEGRVTIRWRA
jgi:DNA invertase Pin-like site-specific DNA recombinase